MCIIVGVVVLVAGAVVLCAVVLASASGEPRSDRALAQWRRRGRR